MERQLIGLTGLFCGARDIAHSSERRILMEHKSSLNLERSDDSNVFGQESSLRYTRLCRERRQRTLTDENHDCVLMTAALCMSALFSEPLASLCPKALRSTSCSTLYVRGALPPRISTRAGTVIAVPARGRLLLQIWRQ